MQKLLIQYIEQIILFGSLARGDDNEDSDIDILKISYYRNEIWSNICKTIADILINKQEIISAHIISENHAQEIDDFTFMNNIKEEGVVIG